MAGLLLAAALAATGTPSAATAATTVAGAHRTVVQGDVTAAGRPLAGVTVGFWARTGHRLTSGKTSRNGRFTLRVPSSSAGFVYAGTTPDSTAAVFASSGTRYVRGVIGADQGASPSFALYQGHPAAVARRLNHGHPLHFRLQRAGRLVVDGDHLDGVALQNRAGGPIFGPPEGQGPAGCWMVPGRYRLVPRTSVPWLASPRTVTVRSGTQTVRVTPRLGATLNGRLTLQDGGPVQEQVLVELLQHGSRVAATRSSATGTYELPTGLAPGEYTVRIGVNPRIPKPGPDDDEVPPLPDTLSTYAQTVLPREVSVTVLPRTQQVVKDVALAPAGSVRASAPGASFAWLEQDDGTMVARAAPGADGSVTFGGAVPGDTYRVVARAGAKFANAGDITRWGQSDPVRATAGMLDAGAVPLTRASLSVSGGMQGRDHGLVKVTDAGNGSLFSAWAGVHPASWFVAANIVPGLYQVSGTIDGISTTTVTVRVTGDTADTPAQVQAPGKPSGLRARFVSGSAPAHGVSGRLRGPGGLVGIGQMTHPGGSPSVRLTSLAPGSYDATSDSDPDFGYYGTSWGAPSSDGPWWFGAPSLSVQLKPGRTKDVGTVALHVHGG